LLGAQALGRKIKMLATMPYISASEHNISSKKRPSLMLSTEAPVDCCQKSPVSLQKSLISPLRKIALYFYKIAIYFCQKKYLHYCLP